jgi:hypothetical protein
MHIAFTSGERTRSPRTRSVSGTTVPPWTPRPFRYVRELAEGHDAVLEFRVEIEGVSVNGVDMIKWEDEGKIVEFKVMIRPSRHQPDSSEDGCEAPGGPIGHWSLESRFTQAVEERTMPPGPKKSGLSLDPKSKSQPKAGATGKTASQLIDQRIRDLGGWRGETLARMRALILEADPEMTEEWKWGGPVWSHHGIVCTGEAYTKVVKLTFARGAKTPDPSRLFNSSLEGNTRRAIDIHEGEKVDARAFKALVKAAVAHNGPPAK